jgi:hypothetical protein
MSIHMKCNGCGAKGGKDGGLVHSSTCPGQSTLHQGNIMPSSTITFDTPEEQAQFLEKLNHTSGSDMELKADSHTEVTSEPPQEPLPQEAELRKAISLVVANYDVVGDQNRHLTNYIMATITEHSRKTELYARLHETIESFQAGRLSAEAYSFRHAEITEALSNPLVEES